MRGLFIYRVSVGSPGVALLGFLFGGGGAGKPFLGGEKARVSTQPRTKTPVPELKPIPETWQEKMRLRRSRNVYIHINSYYA